MRNIEFHNFIFTMSTDEISAYHDVLLRYLYKKENITKYKLWAKKDKDSDIVEKATKLKFYDDKANKILPKTNILVGAQVVQILGTN